MKKLYIILIVILGVVLAAGAVYYKYYYPYSGDAPQISEEELSCKAYYGFYNQKKPGTPDNWVYESAGRSSLWHAPDFDGSIIDCGDEQNEPVSDENPPDQPLIGGCAGVALVHLQECCDRWAAENGIAHIACAGEWQIKDNKCAWVCM